MMMVMNFIALISDHTHFRGVSNLNAYVVDADANTSIPGASHAAQCSPSITPARVKRHITTRWKFNDYAVFETSTDGNCLFDALSHQLASVRSIAKTAQLIRRELTEYVRCHPDLRDILSTDAIEDLQVEQYLKQMKTAGCWGDGIMLTAASLLYNTPVTVVMEDGSHYTVGSELMSEEHLRIGFVSLSGSIPDHFVSLLKQTTAAQIDAEDHNAKSSKATCGDGPSFVPQLASDSSNLNYKVSTKQTTSKQAGKCSCCQGEMPSRPEANVLGNTGKTYGTDKKRKTRTVQAKWFQDFPWLSYCVARTALFCHYCRTAERQQLLTFSKNAETAFTVDGFQNWKKAISRFQQHEASTAHKEALSKLSVVKQMPVTAQLVGQQARNQESRRQMLLKQLTSLRLLLRQGLAVRGHDDIEGNLEQLLRLRAEDCPDLADWIRDHKYMSVDVVNEMITIMSNSVLRAIINDIQHARWFAIMADETRDVSGAEQFTVCVRWVTDRFTVNEDLLGLVDVPTTDSATLYSVLEDVLIRCNLLIDNCRGQAYDGASNLSGHLSGVAARMLAKQPAALAVHCLAHCINLCLQEVSSSCRAVRDALNTVHDVTTLIKTSPKRMHIFEDFKRNAELGSCGNAPSLKPLCPTRWTVRTCCIDSVLKNYNNLSDALEAISTSGYDDGCRKAAGLSVLLDKFSTLFGMKLARLLFSKAEQLATAVQKVGVSAEDVMTAVNAIVQFYSSCRNDSEFNAFFSSVVEESKGKTEEPCLPRQKRVPRRIDSDTGSIGYQHTDVESFYRQQYYEALDTVISELKRRFEQKGMGVAQELETLLLSAANGSTFSVPQSMIEIYSKDIDVRKLRNQLELLPDVILPASCDKVATVRQLAQLLDDVQANSPTTKVLMSEVNKLLQIYYTLPITSATAERTFSAMRRLKNYMRATMTQKRLNNIMLMHCHKDRVDALDLITVAKTFIDANDRRHKFFGSF